MANEDFLAQFVPEAKARRESAATEVARLDAFLALVGEPTSRQTRRTNSPKTMPAPTRSTGTVPGQRPSEDMINRVQQYIAKHPGTTITDMSKHLRVHANTIRRSVKVLQIEHEAVQSLGRQFGDDRREHFALVGWTPSPSEEAAPVAA